MILTLFFLALVVSAILVPVWRVAACRLGMVRPVDERRPRSRATVRFGGVVIGFTLFAGSVGIGELAATQVMILSGAGLFLFGIASELLSLKPSTKLIALVAVASVFLFFDYRLHWSNSQTVDSIMTLFWIVAVTSAFNLLDNMDGLCAGIALIAGTAFVLTVVPANPGSELFFRTEYLAILLGALAGFLIYNVYPASIVMGDSGSLLVGLNMAAMTLQIAPGRGSNLVSIVAVPLLVLLIPFVDAALVMVSRLLPGRPVVDGPAYSSQRLVAIGLSERAAVGLLWVLAAVSGAIAVITDRSDQDVAGLIAAIFTVGMAIFAVYLARVRVHEGIDSNRLPGTITPLGVGYGYRRLAEVVLDLLLVSIAYYGAYRLQFNRDEWPLHFDAFRQTYPILLSAQMIALFALGAYRGMWRYFSLSDGVTFAKAVFFGSVVSLGAVLLLRPPSDDVPRIFMVYSMMALLILTGSRASFRVFSEFARRQRDAGSRLVIYGADDKGSLAARQVLNDADNRYRIVGFVDDDARKRHMRVHGYPVIGGYDHLVGMIMAGDIDAVAVTHDGSATPGLGALCAKHGVTLHRLAIDWSQIPAAEAVGGGTVIPPLEARVVPFTEARRERGAAPLQGLPRVAPSDPLPVHGRAGTAAPSAVIEPIRVVHIITRLILGGAQENTLYTAIGQHRDPRFDVTLLCGIDEAGEGNMFGEVNRAGLKTVVMPSLLREIRPLTDLKALVDVYRFLKKGRYTVVHTHSSKAGIIGRIAAKAAGVPVIVHTLHGVVFHQYQSPWKNRTYIALKRFCAPMAHKIISVSAIMGKAALDRGIGRPDQHITIFSGIELDLFLSVRDRLSVEEAKRRVGIPADAAVVGKIARFFELKGHDQFLEAAAQIARQAPETYFLLVGDGPLRDKLRADAARLGIGHRVVMTGRVRPESVPDFIQAMDVVVHTSLREGIARVLPQAGAVGKPVVTFDLDGAPEVIRDGVSGYLVPAVDTNRVAERTVELLRDPERRRVFGEAGRAFATEHFSVERMIEQINNVYLELLSRRDQTAEQPRPALD